MLQNFYDPTQGRLVLPDAFIDVKNGAYTPDYNSIYPDCQDDIDEAFGLNLPKAPKEMYQLSKTERLQVLEKLKKYSTYPDAIMPGAGVRDFGDEFSKVLAEFKKTRCWIFKDAKGQEYGVRPPQGFFGVLGVLAMPWNLMRIDYDAQRWTDIPHIAKILIKFDAQMAQGITARIHPDGKLIDVNEGRHGAMLIALTGAPHCWGRAIVSENRGRNFDIFELLNIIPKATELFDEFRIKAGRARMYKEASQDIKQDVGGKIEDQHAYDLTELNLNHDVQFVPSAKKKGGKKTLLKKGDAFRVDKFYSFFEDPRYSFKDDSGKVTDTYLADAYSILREAYYEGYMPHEPAWAICELFKQTARAESSGVLSTNKRSKMRKVITTVLNERYHISKYDDGHKQAEAFYKEFGKVRSKVDYDEPFAGYISSNNFVEYFLTTALYSMIQESDLIKATDKVLFAVPIVDWASNGIRDNNGDLFSYTTYLTDPKDDDIDGFEDVEEDDNI
jgi:hypothetical protein